MSCVRRRDTRHPVFHGCVDWHSSVHAHYALHALYRLTGKREYRVAANAALTRSAVASELNALRRGTLQEEVPYGYAWLLALAAERERSLDRRDLRPLADEAARRLDVWISSLSSREITAALAAPDYRNLSWALVNLVEWAKFQHDARLLRRLQSFVGSRVAPDAISARCDAQAELERSEFLPPCLLSVMVSIRAARSERELARIRTVLRGYEVDWTPLAPHELAGHTAGLNFSRSWALWSIYAVTRDVRYREAFREHMTALLSRPRYWAGDYRLYGHWVAQFGVYALALTYDRP